MDNLIQAHESPAASSENFTIIVILVMNKIILIFLMYAAYFHCKFCGKWNVNSL